jgi:hypothetical protein
MPPPDFSALVSALMVERDMSLRGLAREIPINQGQLSRVLNRVRPPSQKVAARCDEIFGTGDLLAQAAERTRSDVRQVRLAASASVGTDAAAQVLSGGDLDAELVAVELARRIEASDVGDATLDRLEGIADALAMAYAGTPPQQLLPRVRRHLGYVAHLVEARQTLEQQRRLLVAGGWLSLLAATLHIDLRQGRAAHAWLVTAEQLAGSAGHDEIRAWCYETRAWQVLTDGRYRDALTLAQRAQASALTGSSAHIQATAQEGRAWARMGRPAETRDALARVARLAGNLTTPDHPEHHYRYDPAKAISYTATTLAWVGDPAAEGFAGTSSPTDRIGKARPRPGAARGRQAGRGQRRGADRAHLRTHRALQLVAGYRGAARRRTGGRPRCRGVARCVPHLPACSARAVELISAAHVDSSPPRPDHCIRTTGRLPKRRFNGCPLLSTAMIADGLAVGSNPKGIAEQPPPPIAYMDAAHR